MPYLQCASVWYLVHDTLDECRLSLAVLADESHFLASLDDEVDMLEDEMIIAFLYLVAYHGIVTRAEAWREFQPEGRCVYLVNLDRHNLLELPYALLYLHSLCRLVSEPLYEGLRVGYLLLLVLVGTYLLLAAFFPQHDILVILHLIVLDMPADYLYGAVCHIVDERPVMRNEHDSA